MFSLPGDKCRAECSRVCLTSNGDGISVSVNYYCVNDRNVERTPVGQFSYDSVTGLINSLWNGKSEYDFNSGAFHGLQKFFNVLDRQGVIMYHSTEDCVLFVTCEGEIVCLCRTEDPPHTTKSDLVRIVKEAGINPSVLSFFGKCNAAANRPNN